MVFSIPHNKTRDAAWRNNLLNLKSPSGFPQRDILSDPKTIQFNHVIEESRLMFLSQEINDPLPNTAGNMYFRGVLFQEAV